MRYKLQITHPLQIDPDLARVGSETFTNREMAEDAQRLCNDIIDQGVASLEALCDSGVEHAIRDLAAHRMEIVPC
jgi:hypothetical protein